MKEGNKQKLLELAELLDTQIAILSITMDRLSWLENKVKEQQQNTAHLVEHIVWLHKQLDLDDYEFEEIHATGQEDMG